MFMSCRSVGTTRLSLPCPRCLRQVSTTSALSSGHNKWSTIKHDKGRVDAARSKQRAAMAKAISDASKLSGPDPMVNPQLADAVAKAKRAGFPKAGIETAIARGQGKSTTGAQLETVIIEAVVPPVALIVECETDSKARALQDLRLILKSAGAQATPTAYLFEKRGRIVFARKEGMGTDEVLETALEAGAIDVAEDEDGRIVVDTEPASLKETEKALIDAYSLELAGSETIWFPNPDTRVQVEAEPLNQLSKLQDELEEYPGVQAVYMNIDMHAMQENRASA